MDELTYKNTTALNQAITNLSAQVYAQQIRIDGLVAAMSGLLDRMAWLEQLVTAHKAAVTGHGPTVR